VEAQVKKVKLNQGYYHEAMDRAAMVASIFDDFLHGHPAVAQTPELRKASTKLIDGLYGFYQLCGQAHHEFCLKE
jgi:hypothetical protein